MNEKEDDKVNEKQEEGNKDMPLDVPDKMDEEKEE